MQYIVTEEEYDELVKKAKGTKYKETIQKLCREVAIHKPIKVYWHKEEEPWGCILNESLQYDDDEDNDNPNCGYCDECPVQDICPYEYKRWSK